MTLFKELAAFMEELNFKINDGIERSINIITENESFTVTIRTGNGFLSNNFCDEPHLAIRINEYHLRGLMDCRCEILELYLKGRMKAGGNLPLLLSFVMAVGHYQEKHKSERLRFCV
ncbi:MAG: hypothetical protein JXR86_20035 [Spirochaetales bacterium]|nr:hypothetical protein [Spirochaetales bacterium]